MTKPTTPPICQSCDSPDIQMIWHDQLRTIRRCIRCGLLFVFPQPSFQRLDNELQSAYFTQGRKPQQTRLDLEFDLWRQPALKSISKAIRRHKPSGTLLDIGCAGGALFDHFSSADWDLYGVEPSALAFGHASRRSQNTQHIHLIKGYLSDTDFPAASFDVITVLETIYYFPDPQAILAIIARLLKDDGLLVIEIPGYYYHLLLRSGPLSYLASRSWCTLPSSHLFYFSRRSLSAMLGRQGLQIAEVLPLEGSVFGSPLARTTRHVLFQMTKVLFAISASRCDAVPRVLYLCRKKKAPMPYFPNNTRRLG